jgi:hypothetical protein
MTLHQTDEVAVGGDEIQSDQINVNCFAADLGVRPD